jgi:hypothetical protein
MSFQKRKRFVMSFHKHKRFDINGGDADIRILVWEALASTPPPLSSTPLFLIRNSVYVTLQQYVYKQNSLTAARWANNATEFFPKAIFTAVLLPQH